MNSPQMGSRIPVAGPWITEKEVAYVTDAARHGWYDRANEYIDRFESSFANYVGRRFAISLPSCTSGLHLSLLALGIGPGDEVIVPDITWIATAAPINYVGATPVFADIDPNSWCMTAETIKAKVTPRTKAIIVVDLYGNMPDMNPILSFAKELSLAIIEDAAEAIGSRYEGKMAGAFGVFSAFSFHGTKTLTTGEGGMLTTNSDEIAEKARIMRKHGAPSRYYHTEIGWNFKLPDLNAALGITQLKKLPKIIKEKNKLARNYSKLFYEEIGGEVITPTIKKNCTHTFNLYNLRFKNEKIRNSVMQFLNEKRIETRVCFPSVHLQPIYEKLFRIPVGSYPVSEECSKTTLCMPMFSGLTETDQERIVKYVRDILKV